MALRDLFSKKEVNAVEVKKVEEKKLPQGFNLETLPLGKELAPKLTGNYLNEYREWVYANANARAKAVSAIQFELYQLKKNDEPVEIFSHPLLELLDRINDFQTGRDFFFNYQLHEDLAGEDVWFLDRNGSDNPKIPPTAMYPLRPDYLTVIPADLSTGQFISHYEYTLPSQEPIIFKPYEILFPHTVDPTNPYRGMSIIKAGATTIETDTHASDWNRRFFQNSARPDAVLYTDQRLNDDSFKRIYNQWMSKFMGTSNSHKMAILEAGLRYDSLQASQKDMEFLAQQKWTRDKIMALFGNTPIMLGVVDDVNRANAETSEYVWTKYTIKPLMQALCDYLNEYLVPIFGDNLFLSFKDPVPENHELKITEAEKLTNKVYTTNEARAKFGLPPVEGGDVIYQPFNLIEMGKDNTLVPAKSERMMVVKRMSSKENLKFIRPEIKREIIKLKSRNARREKQVEELKQDIYAIVQQMVSPEKKVVKKSVDLASYEMKAILHDNLIKMSLTYEERFKSIMNTEIYPLIEFQSEQNIRGNVTEKGAKKKLFDPFVSDDVEVVAEMNFRPLVEEIVGMQGAQMLKYLNLNEILDMTTPLVKKEIETNVKKLANSLTKTAKDKIANAIKDGLDDGLGQDAIVREMRKAVKDLSKVQAERIAITEVSKATNVGLLQAFKQGNVIYKEWFTSLDERVCPYCREMEGEVLPVGKSFWKKGETMKVNDDNGDEKTLTFDYETIETPPLHTSCRCTLSPAFEAKHGGKYIVEKTEVIDVDPQEILDKLTPEIEKIAKQTAEKTAEQAVVKSTKEDKKKLEKMLSNITEVIDGQKETGTD